MVIEDIVMESTPPHPDNPFAWGGTKINTDGATGGAAVVHQLPDIKNEISNFRRDIGGGRLSGASPAKGRSQKRNPKEGCGIYNFVWEILL